MVEKNPLAMPPDFDKLPTPGNKEINPETFTDNKEKRIIEYWGDRKQLCITRW